MSQCATCPDPPTCARLLDEKWRQAYNACFRFGPCQPSMVYRYLRGLEGVTPPLALTQLSCQTTAKAFTITREWMFAIYDAVYNFIDMLLCQYLTGCSPLDFATAAVEEEMPLHPPLVYPASYPLLLRVQRGTSSIALSKLDRCLSSH